ncbi:hypothetical protein EV175_005807, partial [Coemansia sp. RSA 1933]
MSSKNEAEDMVLASAALHRPTLRLDERAADPSQEAARVVGTAFPRVSERMGDDDGADSRGTGKARKARRSIGSARTGGGDGGTKTRSRVSSKVTPVSTQQHSASNSSDTTISELQQRLEVMAREKVSLESAIEHEQERVFNQNRRLSGSMSPMAHMGSM